MAGKVVQMDMLQGEKTFEQMLVGMIKGLFARDQAREKDIKQLIAIIQDLDEKLDRKQEQIDNLAASQAIQEVRSREEARLARPDFFLNTLPKEAFSF